LGVSTAEVLVVPAAGGAKAGRAGTDGAAGAGNDLWKPSLGMIGGPPNWAEAVSGAARKAAAANKKG
jgi:hypothetical protein